MTNLNKKRKKSSRHRGTHTHSRGAKKKARGKGHRGGVGMSGSGKRADQKKTLVLKKYGRKYFRKDLSSGKKTKELKVVSLSVLIDNPESFVKKGIAKEVSGKYEFNLKGYKLIGKSEKKNLSFKISVSAASEGVKESVKNSGGEITIIAKEGKKVLAEKQENEISES